MNLFRKKLSMFLWSHDIPWRKGAHEWGLFVPKSSFYDGEKQPVSWILMPIPSCPFCPGPQTSALWPAQWGEGVTRGLGAGPCFTSWVFCSVMNCRQALLLSPRGVGAGVDREAASLGVEPVLTLGWCLHCGCADLPHGQWARLLSWCSRGELLAGALCQALCCSWGTTGQDCMLHGCKSKRSKCPWVWGPRRPWLTCFCMCCLIHTQEQTWAVSAFLILILRWRGSGKEGWSPSPQTQ